ncbi:MAG: hypothetical protein HYZ44_11055 [Bacteroidetes bacterium]|nr:hypothetical protein [Bacteroidota bacterium]
MKGKAGMYQSNSSMPYKIYMLQGNVSAGVYLLRLKTIKYHTFEPYVSVGASYQQAKFYGYYLPTDDDGKPVSTNYSNTDSPMLGKTGSTFINVTTGVEYQLESDTHMFLHLFAEVNYGILISSQSSNASFNGTTPSNLSALSVGISFGSIR